MSEILEIVGGSILPELLIKGALVLAFAGLLVWGLKQASAATRHAAWTVGLALLLLLPLGLRAVPDWGLPTAQAPTEEIDGAVQMPIAFEAASDVETDAVGNALESATVSPLPRGKTSVGGANTDARRRDLGPPLAVGAALIWAVGFLLVLAMAMRDVFRIAMITRFGTTRAKPELQNLMDRVAASLGLGRPLDLRLTQWTEVPVTWGLFRPVVLLPESATEWEGDRLRAALVHELAHVQRLDYLWHFLGEIAAALHWPNPLAWLALRRMRMEQERACDNVVLRDGMGAADYADQLIDIARSMSRPSLDAATAMAGNRRISARLEDILDTALNRSPLSPGRTLLHGLALVAVGLVTAGATVQRPPGAPASVLDVWSLSTNRSPAAMQVLLDQLSSPSAERRGVAALSLGGREDQAAVRPLIQLLDDTDPVVRENAAESLARLKGEGTAEGVATLLRDSIPSVRSVASWALGEIGGPVAVEALLRTMVDDPDHHTRIMASAAVTRIQDVDVVPLLIGVLHDAPADRRADLVMALGEFDDPRIFEPLSEIVSGDPDPVARRNAIRAVSHDDPRRIDLWIRAQQDEDWRVRNFAVVRLGEEDDRRSLAAVMSALRDPVHQVRLNAAWALEDRGR